MSALVLRPQPMRRLSHPACQNRRWCGCVAALHACLLVACAPTALIQRAQGASSECSIPCTACWPQGPARVLASDNTCATSTLPCPTRPQHSVACACLAPGAHAGTHSTSWFSRDPACLPHPLAAHPRPKCWPEKANARNAWTLRHHRIPTRAARTGPNGKLRKPSERAWAWAVRERQSGTRPVAQAAAKRLTGASCPPAAVVQQGPQIAALQARLNSFNNGAMLYHSSAAMWACSTLLAQWLPCATLCS